MKKKFRNNKTSTPHEPKKAEAQATRCLTILLNGGKINRKTLDKLGIAEYNDSAHSLMSLLRNKRYIPIESPRIKNGTSDYFMKAEEIARYNDPILREQQREDMREHVESKRINTICKHFSQLLNRLDMYPKLWQYASTLPATLKAIEKAITALLVKKKGGN